MMNDNCILAVILNESLIFFGRNIRIKEAGKDVFFQLPDMLECITPK